MCFSTIVNTKQFLIFSNCIAMEGFSSFPTGCANYISEVSEPTFKTQMRHAHSLVESREWDGVKWKAHFSGKHSREDAKDGKE